MIVKYPLSYLAQYAKEHSPFYREQYKGIVIDENLLTRELPLIDLDKFWQANTFDNNQLLTGSMNKGVFFKSGGTSGKPKFSVFSQAEWENFTHCFGLGMESIGLTSGDRVANLFYVGDLYASFVFIMKSLEYCSTEIMHFPITGLCTIEDMISNIEEYQLNVLAGVPTTLIQLLEELFNRGQGQHIETLLFGGESFYPDQRQKITDMFPNIRISSIGYASVDAGHLGYVNPNLGYNEHLVFDNTIMEIIDDETGAVIVEPGRPGALYYTNLSRKLMPIIRYPVGDRGMWLDVNQRFRILGRSEQGARVGVVTLYRQDLEHFVASLDRSLGIISFQLIITRKQCLDTCCLNLATLFDHDDSIIPAVRELFYQARPLYLKEVEKGHILPIDIKLVPLEGLETNSRTGKLKQIIDRR
ncbi:AMP-binding protein [Shewanella sp. VB17]|uniref:phenylacetate--CoA ligase family protein n=1 Tax=Shewanella sp. VB17 TaxID=2739432 RepID=UPI001565A3A8|nr:AMP-binding protein [Shewanella sp. VB17]NRD75220.1 AMP-binding protein [Shewanella sp. VB17]